MTLLTSLSPNFVADNTPTNEHLNRKNAKGPAYENIVEVGRLWPHLATNDCQILMLENDHFLHINQPISL